MNRILAVLSGAAVLAFLLIVLALLILAPDVNPLRLGISFYALSGFRALIGIALSLVGAGGILIGIALWRLGPPPVASLGVVLLILWGVSSITAAAFPLDPIGAVPTLSGTIHNLAGLNFLLITVAVFLVDRPRDRAAEARGGIPSPGWLHWIVLGMSVLLFLFNGPLAIAGIGGLIQRLYWIAVCIWLLAQVRSLLQSSKTSLSA